MSAMNTGGGGSASLAIICYPYQGLRKICGEDRKEENLSKSSSMQELRLGTAYGLCMVIDNQSKLKKYYTLAVVEVRCHHLCL